MTKRKLARISPTTGAPVTTFTANANARVTALAVSNNWVYVGGQFTTMNSVSQRARRGQPDHGCHRHRLQLADHPGHRRRRRCSRWQLKLTTDDGKLLVVHTGRNVAGQQRVAAAVINTTAKTLDPWNTNLYANYLPVVGGVMRHQRRHLARQLLHRARQRRRRRPPPVNGTAVRSR